MDGIQSQDYDRFTLLSDMEKEFENENAEYFKNLINHQDNIIRTRAVCILAEIAGEEAVQPISYVLHEDNDALVRHEAAFSLGQLGFSSGINALVYAVKEDPSFFVRHEAAIALGVIGLSNALPILKDALNDQSPEVRESAEIAIANIEYIEKSGKNNKFTKLTGG